MKMLREQTRWSVNNVSVWLSSKLLFSKPELFSSMNFNKATIIYIYNEKFIKSGT